VSLPLAREISSILRSNGFEAYLVGGCVRDQLLGLIPKDFDIATDARPEQVARLFPGAYLVGAHFGVVLVRRNGDEVEVATFRSEGAYVDGRRPEHVEFERDPRQDVLRRDFTINALMLDPESSEVLDFVGGRADLDACIVRAIGNPEARFQEDHLRMLRAVRFAATLSFAIDPATLQAIRSQRANISSVAAERVRDELTRILTEGGARRGFELLDETGLLEEVLPEVAAMKGVAQPPEFHPEGDVWTHTLLILENLGDASAELAWGALLHDVGKPPTYRVAERIRFDGHVEAGLKLAAGILDRLRFSNDSAQHILALVANHMRFSDTTKMKNSTLKRFLRTERFEDHLELHRLDCLSSHRHLGNYDFVKRKLEELPPEQLMPQRLLTGDDLIQAGYTPGEDFRKMLETAEDAQLEHRIGTKAEALALIRDLFGAPGETK
jgi:poly(A) polymerase